MRACWLTLKYGLAFLGGLCWLTLWFERHPLAGLVQLLIVFPACWAELEHRAATGRW